MQQAVPLSAQILSVIYLVAGLSLPSMIKSKSGKMNLARDVSTSLFITSTSTSELSSLIRVERMSALACPVSDSRKKNCLCRFERSMVSKSAIQILPMPEAASPIAQCDPRAPQPITSTLDSRSLRTPSSPNEGMAARREYRFMADVWYDNGYYWLTLCATC